MKHVLVYCNTYYQLLVAIQLQRTLKRQDRVSVLLTDESRGAEEIAQRLRAAGFFHGVYSLNTKVSKAQVTATYKLRMLRGGIFGSLPADMPRDYVCHEFIGFNLDLATHSVYAALYRRNRQMVCSAMEEGLLSYRTPRSTSGLLRSVEKIRTAFGWENLHAKVGQFYCFYPKAYAGDLEPVAIPRLSSRDQDLRELLQQVFLAGQPLAAYRQRYMYLPCIYDISGGAPIGERELTSVLCQGVGAENLLIKVHPREDADAYRGAGAEVDTNSAVPFEVLCILQDLSQKVLITTLSGSVLNISALLENPPACYYAYPLCQLEGNPLARRYRGVVSRYLDPESGMNLANIRLLEDLSQLTKERI